MGNPDCEPKGREGMEDVEGFRNFISEIASTGASTQINAEDIAIGNDSDAASIFRSCVAHEELLRRVMSMAPCDLTRTEMSILTTLNAVGPLAMTPLSQCIAVSKEQASRAVKPLVDLGYVERHHSEKNRRVVMVQLTEEGTSFLDELMDDALASLDELLGPLSDEERDVLISASTTGCDLINKALEPKRNLYEIEDE